MGRTEFQKTCSTPPYRGALEIRAESRRVEGGGHEHDSQRGTMRRPGSRPFTHTRTFFALDLRLARGKHVPLFYWWVNGFKKQTTS